MLTTLAVVSSESAFADLRVCNNTNDRVALAVGYKSDGDWTTKGWWDLDPGTCESVVTGKLSNRYFYLHAAGRRPGRAFLCTGKGHFTIHGSDRCLERGLDRTGFVEVDTRGQPEWTVELNGPAEAPHLRLSNRMPPPMLPDV